MDKQLLDEYNKIHLNNYNQKYTGLFLHPEAGEDPKINESFNTIKEDLNNIDNILIDTANSINDLMNNTVARLQEVKKCIISEKERYQDIQMLCNKYTDFDNVKTLDNINFTGDCSVEDGTYFASIKKTNKNQLTILDVYGNGYEGNEYVYNNYEYQKDIYDTSAHENMIDNKISTYYEYSRITVLNKEDVDITYFNKDNEKARCTISFQSDDLVNQININTEDLGVSITGIQYSMDGIKYTSLAIPEKMSINNKLDSYNNYGYIYGSGIINIPPSYFFKLTFESDKNKDDVIAYEKTIISNEENSLSNNAIPITNTSTYIVNSARRSSIKINDISAYKNIFNRRSMIKSSELITADSYSIAVFANEYVPHSLNADAIKFILTVNGIDYDIVPINSNSNGIKVIRFSGGKSNTIYTQLINEKITSAYLSVIFNAQTDATAYINNIKILIGGEI